MATRRGVPSTSATLTDVARLAGVSIATASRALNGSQRSVSADSADRVRAAAERLGYLPNESAQSMVRGRTNNIGLIVRDIAEPYFAGIASGLIDELESTGMHVSIAVTSDDLAREIEQVRMFRRQRAAAVVLVGSRRTDEPHAAALMEELRHIETAGGRVVMLSHHQFPFRSVLIGNREGSQELASALLEVGYTEFTIVGGPSTYVTAKDRVQGFRDGLAERAAVVDDVRTVESGFGWQGGFDVAEQVLELGRGPRRVVFAVNDLVALGLLARWRELGVAVPSDIALAGFDDIPTLRDVRPWLTSVEVPLMLAGRSAARLAAAVTDGNVTVSTVVKMRESTPAR
ncbi:LacI family DNA-binding transcriptional regulator [Aeromicrobium ginsengisoli]|uniref:LacI family transcriptional regulator n=1 Tax=Aeromicrobium ginsengisoli TaxID=363867 RepID=A0A5M4FG52_9ACTN|nr:LacI family DNA-binding transcriptional regulator [Aeromicrobium ginsengisoli]KAA1397763.1 LacI family transcriptional regulator [Aeromicrobium ginsengisoli]